MRLGTMRRFWLWPTLFLVFLALLIPKVSAVIMHLHPSVTTAVICTGSELVVLRLGPDGNPIQATATDHAPCVLAGPDETAGRVLLAWVAAPRCYRCDFVAIAHLRADNDRLVRLPDLRGPPDLV